MFFIFIWNITSVQIYNKRGFITQTHTSLQAKYWYANYMDIPMSHVLLYKHTGHLKQITNDFLITSTCSVAERPVSGDHIHMAISFWIGKHPRLLAEHDREPIQSLYYEPPFGKDSNICKIPGNISYKKTWSHVGVHTHCDGLIHVHPWSAPKSIRKEGLDVQLGLWFDQVGIQYREWPTISIEFADGNIYSSNKTHQWHIAEKICFKDKKPTKIYTSHLDQIWLGHAYASYIAWFGPKDSTIPNDIPNDIPSRITHLKNVGVHGAFNTPYPQDCI